MRCRRLLPALILLVGASGVEATCKSTGVQLQVLGSGGPGSSGGRASSGYLLWVDGVARIMVDAGSGTKDQFHRSGADLTDLRLIAVSHFHPDHASELPGIFWPTGATLRIAGPAGNGVIPGLDQFLARLFGSEGAFGLFGDRLHLDPMTVDVSGNRITEVWHEGDMRVSATGVPHGNVPTLAYRIEVGDKSIAFASDQNGSKAEFADFASGVGTLVIHLSLAEDVTGFLTDLHAKPSAWGKMATAARAGQVVVSHYSFVPGAEFDASLAILRDNYRGPVTIADDLACVDL